MILARTAPADSVVVWCRASRWLYLCVECRWHAADRFSRTATPVLLVTLADTVSGAYTVTQLAPVLHPLGADENDVSFTINYIVKDGNGDFVAGEFVVDVNDDTPAPQIALLVGKAVVDETVDGIDDGLNGTDPFSFGTPLGVASTLLVNVIDSKPGADFAGAVTSIEVVYSSGNGNGTNSDLDTTDGRSIFLYKEGKLIVGRAETSVGSGANPQGDVAFALTIDNSGTLTVAQYLSLHHPDPTNPDEALLLSGFIAAQVTVTEADGDVADGVAGDCCRG